MNMLRSQQGDTWGHEMLPLACGVLTSCHVASRVLESTLNSIKEPIFFHSSRVSSPGNH
ncbi:hypothetical protein PO909_009613 [Leuciscus waleckii]